MFKHKGVEVGTERRQLWLECDFDSSGKRVKAGVKSYRTFENMVRSLDFILCIVASHWSVFRRRLINLTLQRTY